MKKNIFFLILAGTLMLVACGRLATDEDTWLCTNQGWMKHGNPSAPMPTEPCAVKPDENPVNIRVTAPLAKGTVSSPFTVTGEARVFESQFNWKLKDANDVLLSEGTGMTAAPDVGQFGPFAVVVDYSYPAGGPGTLEVFDYSAKDGSVEDLVSIPLNLKPSEETTKIKLFFANSKLDPEITCEKAFPVERTIKKTPSVANAAIQLLLLGPSADERANQYSTLLNDGVHLNKLTIVDGVARADFDKKLDEKVGGSCRVLMIRRQIEETLKQFPAVKEVVISIEGRWEDILQP